MKFLGLIVNSYKYFTKESQVKSEEEKTKQNQKVESQHEKAENSKDISSQQKKIINFRLSDKNETKKLEYQMTDTSFTLMEKLGYEQNENLQIQILNQEGKSIILNSDKSLTEYLDFYINYDAIVKKVFSIKFQEKIIKYAEGTDLQKIRKNQGKKSEKYCFYTKDKKEYKEDELGEDLEMIQVDSVNLYFGEKLNKNIEIPISIPLKNAIEYLQVEELTGVRNLKKLLITKIKVGKNETVVHYKQASTIKAICHGNSIQYITLSYQIQLHVQLFTEKNNKELIFQIFADEKIQQLKTKFKTVCQLEESYQQWVINEEQIQSNLENKDAISNFVAEKQLNDGESFISKKMFENILRVNINEMKNIEYYGFSKQHPIKTETFVNYYIQNDKIFKDIVKSSSFPDPKYEQTFRTMCLGMIFSTIKKHCKIEMALKHIKKLIKQIDFNNQTINKAKAEFWQSNSKNKKTFFNEFYVLHNILLSSPNDLRVELMNIYKNHSSLFLVTQDHQGGRIDYLDSHFWINTKSFVITSIEIGKGVKGKSNLLNHVFNLNFQLTNNRHPSCSKSTMIQYNIYKNEDCMVDLIDVSSNSLGQNEIKGLCQASNMVIIHYVHKDSSDVLKWIENNLKDKPIILFERNSSVSMDKPQQFKRQLEKNNFDSLRKQYQIPELTAQNASYYEDQIEAIMDQIHTFIESQVKSSQNACWNFSYFLANKNKKKKQIVDILRDLQQNFSEVVNITLLKQKPTEENINIMLSPIMRKILDLINKDQNYTKFMSKLRESIRITRSKRIKEFSSINHLQKMVEIKDEKKIKENEIEIKKHIDILLNIKESQKTEKFSEILNKIKEIESYSTNQNVEKLQTHFKQLNIIFIEDIKTRQFSIQNFWRSLNKLFYQDLKLTQELQKYLDITKQLFNKQFKHGKTIEIINGDTLQIPLPLLKSPQIDIENSKVIVVGIFGPQSSGKSTLLNYLFGCDFASSDGRCTNGIYGTYYQIENGCLPCKGIFILDTQGLFSNYKRTIKKGENFDNKLVLFLLKVCDILILNTRGDIDKNCENILEISFDSVLMDHKQGAIYPNFYIVLNQSIGKINDQQENEVRQLRQKITSVNKQMEKYISTNETNSMSIAFNISNKNTNSQTLKRIQRKTKTPTDDFYLETKLLSLRLIEIVKERGSNRQPKFLIDIYDHMNAVWTSILGSPMLTKHASKQLKILDEKLQYFSFSLIKQSENQINTWQDHIPKQCEDFQAWESIKNTDFEKIMDKSLKIMKTNFAFGSDSQINSLIKDTTQKIRLNLTNYYESFKIKAAEKRISIEFDKNKKRGVEGLMKIARQLRKNAYKSNNELLEQKKIQVFQQSWQNHVKILLERLDLQKITTDKYKEVREYYINQLCMQKSSKNCFPSLDSLNIDTSRNYKEYCKKLQQQLFHHLNNSFYSYFSELNVEPIISIKKGGAQSIPNEYLSMKTFFTFEPTVANYYLNVFELERFLNKYEIESRIMDKFMNSKICDDFFNQITDDLAFFKVKIANEYAFKRYLAEQVYKFFKLSYCDQTLSIDLLKQIDPYWINFCRQSKHVSEKDSTKGIFKDYFKHPNKSFRFKVLSSTVVIKSIEEENCIVFESIRWSTLSIVKKILKEVVYHFSFFNQMKVIHEEVASQIIESFKNLGVNINNQKSPISYRLIQFADRSFFNEQIKKQIFTIYQFKLNSQSPIKINSFPQYSKKIESLPYFFNKKLLSSFILSNKTGQYSYLVAQQVTEKIKVIQKYQNVPQLKDYMNKNYQNLLNGVKTPKFKAFIFNHIKTDLIFNKITETIQKEHKMKPMEDLVTSVLVFIKKQIDYFNQDLRQISHQLSFKFLVSIYDFTCNLICKKIEEQERKKIEQKKQALDKEKQKQKEKFLNILNKKSEERCKQEAKNFVQAYEEYIIKIIEKLKEKNLQSRKKQFLNKYTRREFQRRIDSEMSNCEDSKIAERYLLQPKQYLFDQYSKLIEEEIDKYLIELFNAEIMQAFNEIKIKMKKQNVKLKNNEYNWEADTIFKNLSQDQNASTELKKIFFQLMTQKSDINQNYKKNEFKLKAGIHFENLIYMETKTNREFLNTTNFQSIEIENYAFFVQSICNQLELKEKNIKQTCRYTDKQKEEFRVGVQFKTCPFDCPFCGRLCDVDLVQSPHHEIHECFFGHQMRALKNIRILINEDSKNVYYASINRCQEIDNFTMFDYNGTEKPWLEQKKMFPNWSFHSQCQRSQKMMYDRLWLKAGERICKRKQLQNNFEMKFINFNEYDKKIKQTETKQNHFIFSIDGSGSMSSDNKWNQQINQLQEILSELGKNTRNKVSINVFTHIFNIIIKHQYAADIYPKSFTFPSGGTRPSAAIQGAIQIIQETGLDMNTHFIYISDGDGDYPDEQITKILSLKEELKRKGFDFTYTSILIGKNQSHDLFDKINLRMKGNTKWIETATEIAHSFKEVYTKSSKSKF